MNELLSAAKEQDNAVLSTLSEESESEAPTLDEDISGTLLSINDETQHFKNELLKNSKKVFDKLQRKGYPKYPNLPNELFPKFYSILENDLISTLGAQIAFTESHKIIIKDFFAFIYGVFIEIEKQTKKNSSSVEVDQLVIWTKMFAGELIKNWSHIHSNLSGIQLSEKDKIFIQGKVSLHQPR